MFSPPSPSSNLKVPPVRDPVKLTEGKRNDAVTPVQAFVLFCFVFFFWFSPFVPCESVKTQIHSGETSRRSLCRDLIEPRFASFSSLKLTQEIMRGRLVASLSGKFPDDLG